MNYQSLLSVKNTKNIINLSSAEFAQRVVKTNWVPAVKFNYYLAFEFAAL